MMWTMVAAIIIISPKKWSMASPSWLSLTLLDRAIQVTSLTMLLRNAEAAINPQAADRVVVVQAADLVVNWMLDIRIV